MSRCAVGSALWGAMRKIWDDATDEDMFESVKGLLEQHEGRCAPCRAITTSSLASLAQAEKEARSP